jgi:hypothetical protein
LPLHFYAMPTDLNVYRPIQSLQKSPIEVGGLCSLSFFAIEDVQDWPEVDPATGILSTAINMKTGKMIYICQATDHGRSFDEELKYSGAGPYMDIQVAGVLGGHNAQNILTLCTAQFHRWGLICNDRNGNYRLVGYKNSGARLTYKYTSADPSGSRKVNLSWSWQNPLPAPIYQAAVFRISIGGVIVTAGSIRAIASFIVNRPGSPMADGDTVYTNALLAGKKVMVLASSIALPEEDGSNSIVWTDPVTGVTIRHFEKLLADDHLTIVGGVKEGEPISIYEIN